MTLRRIILLGLGLFAILVAVIALITLTPFGATVASWGGDLAPIQIVASTITPLGAMVAVIGLIINGRAANSTLKHAIHSDRALRYQKACELISNPNPVGQTGGLYMLGKLAIEEPKDYLDIVLSTLDTFCSEADEAEKAQSGYFDYPRRVGEMPKSRGTMGYMVIEIISLIQTDLPDWRNFTSLWRRDQALTVNSLYFNAIGGEALRLEDVYFNRSVLGRFQLAECRLKNAQFDIVLLNRGEFIECDLTGAKFTLVGPDLEPVLPQDELLTLIDCKTDGMMVNDLPYEDWLALPPVTKPQPDSKADSQAITQAEAATAPA